jgi:ABC-type transporter Mla MlaB component
MSSHTAQSLAVIGGAALFEATTVVADAARAEVVVGGRLAGDAVAILATVVRAHLAAGRSEIRLDLAAVNNADAEAAERLSRLMDEASERGSALMVENAPPRIAAMAGDSQAAEAG